MLYWPEIAAKQWRSIANETFRFGAECFTRLELSIYNNRYDHKAIIN